MAEKRILKAEYENNGSRKECYVYVMLNLYIILSFILLTELFLMETIMDQTILIITVSLVAFIPLIAALFGAPQHISKLSVILVIILSIILYYGRTKVHVFSFVGSRGFDSKDAAKVIQLISPNGSAVIFNVNANEVSLAMAKYNFNVLELDDIKVDGSRIQEKGHVDTAGLSMILNLLRSWGQRKICVTRLDFSDKRFRPKDAIILGDLDGDVKTSKGQ